MKTIFYTFFYLVLSSYTINVKVMYRDNLLPNASIKIKQKDKVFEFKSNDQKAVTINLPSNDNISISVKKEGFDNLGYFGKVRDIKLKAQPKLGVIKGRVSIKGEKVPNQEITLTNLESNQVTKTKSNFEGIFHFKQVPILQKHIISVKRENFEEFNEEVFIKNVLVVKEIQLKKNSVRVDIKLLGKNIEGRYISVNSSTTKSDSNGFASIEMENLNSDRVKIFVNNRTYFRKIDLNKNNNIFIFEMN